MFDWGIWVEDINTLAPSLGYIDQNDTRTNTIYIGYPIILSTLDYHT